MAALLASDIRRLITRDKKSVLGLFPPYLTSLTSTIRHNVLLNDISSVIMGNAISGSTPSSPPSSDGTVLSTPALKSTDRPDDAAIKSDHYPLWKTATLELSSEGTTNWFYCARGSSSAGHVSFVESTTGKTEVNVYVGYADESALETLNVCLLAKGDRGRGVGVYTPHRIHMPRNPLYIYTVVHIPSGSSMPDHIMTSFTSNTTCSLSLPSVTPLSSLNVETSNGAISLSSPFNIKGNVMLRTSNASIKGPNIYCEELKVVTSNAPIQLDRVSSSSSAIPPHKGTARLRREFVTSNGSVTLPSVDVPARSVECKVESSNQPITITFRSPEAASDPDARSDETPSQQQPRIKVKTSNASVDFKYQIPYTGHLDVRSSGHEGVVLTGLDVGPGSGNDLKKESDGRTWGQVGQASGKDTNGSIDVSSSNARVGITFGL